MQALPKVGRMEVRARATLAADHLTDSFDQRTERAGALKYGFKQVFVADAGTWGQNLNSPVGHSDGGEAGGADERPTCKDGRMPPHRDASERGGAGCVREGLSPNDAPTLSHGEKGGRTRSK